MPLCLLGGFVLGGLTVVVGAGASLWLVFKLEDLELLPRSDPYGGRNG